MISPAASVPPAPPPAARGDFPTWLPAMLVKELRQGLRTKGFVGAFIVFQVIMVLLMLSTVLGSAFGNPTTRASMSTMINGFFWLVLGAQLLFATPGRALASLQVELESRSLDLLVLTRLTAWRIVLGKWGSLMAQALLLFVAMLPYGIVRYFMGSVDLVQDAYQSAALLGGCAVLTAAGLAGSGGPKALRILIPIVVVISFQILPFAFGGMRRGGFPGGSRLFTTLGTAELLVLWFDGACILGIFLVAAVRRIAPPAENHVLLARSLALLTLIPVPLLAFTGRNANALGQMEFAAALIGLMAAVELASSRWPMIAHWRPWVERGALGRLLGRFALPGWPSALLFAYLGAGLIALGIWLVPLPLSPRPGWSVPSAWLVLLALSGLAFPAVVLSFFSGAKRSPALYVLVFGVASLLAAIAAILANGLHAPEALSIANVIPVASFWITIFAPETAADSPVQIGQLVASLAVLGAAWWQSQRYWAQVAALDAQVRSVKK